MLVVIIVTIRNKNWIILTRGRGEFAASTGNSSLTETAKDTVIAQKTDLSLYLSALLSRGFTGLCRAF
jgi:hypothetical protein